VYAHLAATGEERLYQLMEGDMKRTCSLVLFLTASLVSINVWAQQLRLPGVHPTSHASIICVECHDGDGGGGGGGTSTSGPSKVVYHKVDASTHTAEMQFDNGAIMVINYPLNKVTISGGGHTAQLSLDAVLLQKANGNATLATSFKNQLHAKLYKTGLIVDMAAAEDGSAGLTATQRKRRGATQGLLAGPSGGYYGYNCYSYYYCYESSFSSYDWGWYDVGFAAGPSYPNDGSQDFNYWDIWREDHCDSMQSDFQAAGGSVVTMAIGCAFFETGIGAVACAGGGIGVYLSMNEAADNAAVCLSHYPGYGNWGH
jgi:hypothetical protein